MEELHEQLLFALFDIRQETYKLEDAFRKHQKLDRRLLNSLRYMAV